MSPNTVKWLFRVLGIMMVLVFGYMLCSTQQQLMNMQREQQQPPEYRPGGAIDQHLGLEPRTTPSLRARTPAPPPNEANPDADADPASDGGSR